MKGMGFAAVTKAITRKVPYSKAVQFALAEVLENYGEHMLEDLRSTVEPFHNSDERHPEGDQADWDIEIPNLSQAVRAVYVAVKVKDPDGWPATLYDYLDQGTGIRWALMARKPFWTSHTGPGRFPSGPGAGYVAIRGQTAMEARGLAPRNGIEARNFYDYVHDFYQRSFFADVERVVREGASIAGWETRREKIWD